MPRLVGCFTCRSPLPLVRGTHVLRRIIGGHVLERAVHVAACSRCDEKLTLFSVVGAFEAYVEREVVRRRIETADSVVWALDAYGFDPRPLGFTRRDARRWARGLEPMQEWAWERLGPALRALGEPPPPRPEPAHCPLCQGVVVAQTGTGRSYPIDDESLRLPDDLPVPTCATCDERWLDAENPRAVIEKHLAAR